MNCHECRQLLQAHLDGAPAGDTGLLGRHLAACPSCRGCYVAARRLQEGLRLLTPPGPPAGLAQRIVAGVLAERRARRRQRRWALAAVSLAAGLFLVLVLGRRHTPPPPPAPPVVKTPVADQPPGSLRDSVRDASTAVVDLTRRTADETVGQGRLLVPVVVDQRHGPEDITPGGADESLSHPIRSLRDAGQGVSTGLEPVTDSARRALDLFLREVPPMGPEVNKSGL